MLTRTRRAADVTPAAIRASAGALLHLTHARIANIARGLERLKDAGFTVVGLDEQAERTVYEADRPDGRVAVVLGSEGEGLGRLTREACDLLVAPDAWPRRLAKRIGLARRDVVRVRIAPQTRRRLVMRRARSAELRPAGGSPLLGSLGRRCSSGAEQLSCDRAVAGE